MDSLSYHDFMPNANHLVYLGLFYFVSFQLSDIASSLESLGYWSVGQSVSSLTLSAGF